MPFVSIDHEGRVTGGGLADLSGFMSKLKKKLKPKTVMAIASGGASMAISKASKGKADKVLPGMKDDKKKKEVSPASAAAPTEDPGEALPESEMVAPGIQKGGVFKTAEGGPNYLLIGGIGLVTVAGLLLILKKKRKV